MPSSPTQSPRLPSHFDSCCSPYHGHHSSTSKFKTKSDSCPFLCNPLCLLKPGPEESRSRARQLCLFPCLKMTFCALL